MIILKSVILYSACQKHFPQTNQISWTINANLFKQLINKFVSYLLNFNIQVLKKVTKKKLFDYAIKTI